MTASSPTTTTTAGLPSPTPANVPVICPPATPSLPVIATGYPSYSLIFSRWQSMKLVPYLIWNRSGSQTNPHGDLLPTPFQHSAGDCKKNLLNSSIIRTVDYLASHRSCQQMRHHFTVPHSHSRLHLPTPSLIPECTPPTHP
ncbi:hypothetical protein L1887_35764 [Cichorium endivia]|nr:hypothetical protein L1887_35764 [Cichorium endivia]